MGLVDMETGEIVNTITTKVLDDSVSEMYKLRADYEAKKKISNEADAEHKRAQTKVLMLLKQADKERYSVKGVGSVSLVQKLKVKMPTELTAKSKLFDYIRENLGEDGFISYTTINYNSLNTLYNTAYEEAEDKENFSIEGLDAPVLDESVRFRKE